MTLTTHAAPTGCGLEVGGIFAQIVHKTRTAMAIADPHQPDCPLVFINPAFTELTGYDAPSILGRNCRILQGADTDPEAIGRIRRAIDERKPIEEELYNYRRDGSGFWNALYITPIFNDSGEFSCFFANQFDISSRREAQRRQQQRIESIGALASGVAHEFNNLMTVVLASIERATDQASDETQRRHLERADWGAQRAGKLASELLSLSRREVYESHIVDLNRIIRDFEGAMANLIPASIRLDIQAASVPTPARLDQGQLEMVLLNLVRNAADAMQAGGVVTVAARVLSQAEAAASLGGHKAVELRVSDTGHGMQPEIAERATELFFTTKNSPHGHAGPSGTGLGLFLALEFVDKCAGRLAIDSRPGVGTHVTLVFPQAA